MEAAVNVSNADLGSETNLANRLLSRATVALKMNLSVPQFARLMAHKGVMLKLQSLAEHANDQEKFNVALKALLSEDRLFAADLHSCLQAEAVN